MGAWIGGLAICHDARLGFGILMTPVVLMDRLVGELEFVASIRHSIKDQPVDFTRLNLVSYKPRIPREHVLLVEARYDAFVPGETIEGLWEHWDKPEIWRMPHGHISLLGSIGLLNRAVKWVSAASGAIPAARRDTNRLPST
jgi:hypothetical protein